MPDPSSYLNPRVTNAQREKDAEAARLAAAPKTTDYGSKFSKPFTDADKKKQAAALAGMLRKRDEEEY